jgi:hypothetical protein
MQWIDPSLSLRTNRFAACPNYKNAQLVPHPAGEKFNARRKNLGVLALRFAHLGKHKGRNSNNGKKMKNGHRQPVLRSPLKPPYGISFAEQLIDV